MKKILLILFTASLFMSACSQKVEDIIPDIPSPDSPCATLADSNDIVIYEHQNNDLYEYGDGMYDLLGHGTDVTIDYAATHEASKSLVIYIDRLAEDHPEYIKAEYTPNYEYYYSNYSANAIDYLEKLTVEQGLPANNPVSSMALSKNFYNALINNGRFNSAFVYSSYDYINVKKSFAIETPISVLVNYTTNPFNYYINNHSPKEIVRRFGTHLLAKIRVGGRMNSTYQSETCNPDRAYASKVGIKMFTDRIEGIEHIEDVDVNLISKNFNSHRRIGTRGGSRVTYWEGGKLITEEWINSINDENCICVDLWGDDSLIPIYELIADPVKKAEIKEYVDNYLKENKAYLSE
jgi:hypothetical protein